MIVFFSTNLFIYLLYSSVGDNMKFKYFISVILAIVMGFFIGKFYVGLYNNDNSVLVFDQGETLYFVCLDITKESSDNDFVYELKSDGYHVYGAITSKKEYAEIIKDIYNKDYNNVSIEKVNLNNSFFVSILNEYEKLLEIANDSDKLKIEKIILSNYKEMVLTNESND